MITIAQTAGFCFGVKRATDYIEKLKNDPTIKRVYTLGHLIHNRLYIEELEHEGVHSINEVDVEQIAKESNVIGRTILCTRTHGIDLKLWDSLSRLSQEYKNFEVVDLACPFVNRIHEIAKKETTEDTLFLLLGSKNHAESTGIISCAKGEKYIFEHAKDMLDYLKEHPTEKQIIAVCQTTQAISEQEELKKYLLKLYTKAKFFDTICSVTEQRQKEVLTLSKESNTVVVVGGKDSSNTQKLYEIAKKECPNTYWIESSNDLRDVQCIQPISITAGASTPQNIIMEVYKTMSELNFEELLNENLKTIHTGAVVTGIVCDVNDKRVYLDLGTKQTGFIDAEKLVTDPSVKVTDLFKIGDEVKAKVIRVNDTEGVIELDKTRVDNDLQWNQFVEDVKNEPVVEGKVVSTNKGGIVMNVNGREIFVPAKLTGLAEGADLNTLVGTTQKAKIIDVDESKKRTVASIKAYQYYEKKLQRAAQELAKVEAFNKLEVGQKFTVKIKNLTPYGAFVDLGGIDGLIHVSELSWKAIKHPNQVVSVGEEVVVYIKELNAETHKVSLGYKTPEMDKYSIYAANHKKGEVVSAKIVNITPFGAFAELEKDVEGLIHISQIALEKVEKAESVLTVGQIVDVKIIGMDKEKRTISLSIKSILEDQKRAEEQAAYEAEKEAKKAERAAKKAEEDALRAEMAPYISGTID